ncbi:MAG: GYD domain-containing protein [Thermoleophilia bacterium]|nr:GYD domain-containing protein [Thermoleophilia bacterium]
MDGRSAARLESFYFSLGDVDAYVTVEVPDLEGATAVALAVNGSGAATVKVIQLLTPEEVDSAAKVPPNPPNPREGVQPRSRRGGV